MANVPPLGYHLNAVLSFSVTELWINNQESFFLYFFIIQGEERKFYGTAIFCALHRENQTCKNVRKFLYTSQMIVLWALPNSSCSPWMKNIMKHKQTLEPRKRSRNAYKAPNLHVLQPTTDSWAVLGRPQRQKKEAKGGIFHTSNEGSPG